LSIANLMAAHSSERTKRLNSLHSDYCAISQSATLLVKEITLEADAGIRNQIMRRLGDHDRERGRIVEEMMQLWNEHS